ncbi:hypothetical protein J6590_039347 [Homalodisca vitripennis]|nr:hypothetical protein J6590_039347 [Homalodisca vitripennis]
MSVQGHSRSHSSSFIITMSGASCMGLRNVEVYESELQNEYSDLRKISPLGRTACILCCDVLSEERPRGYNLQHNAAQKANCRMKTVT